MTRIALLRTNRIIPDSYTCIWCSRFEDQQWHFAGFKEKTVSVGEKVGIKRNVSCHCAARGWRCNAHSRNKGKFCIVCLECTAQARSRWPPSSMLARSFLLPHVYVHIITLVCPDEWAKKASGQADGQANIQGTGHKEGRIL